MIRLLISVPSQTLTVLAGRREQSVYQISTSKFGLGSEPGSNKTPLGKFRIAEMIGGGALWGTIFQSRQPVGIWNPSFVTDSDLITSRILWIEGLEPGNANTHDRYIYIHGTNQEHLLGTKASHGCIRMSNRDVITLFALVKVGTELEITNKAAKKRTA